MLNEKEIEMKEFIVRDNVNVLVVTLHLQPNDLESMIMILTSIREFKLVTSGNVTTLDLFE